MQHSAREIKYEVDLHASRVSWLNIFPPGSATRNKRKGENGEGAGSRDYFIPGNWKGRGIRISNSAPDYVAVSDPPILHAVR